MTGGSIIGTNLDVRDAEAVRALVEEIVARHGRLDLMFNNAGIGMGGQTHEIPSSHWDRIIDVNIRGVVNGVLAAYPLMVARREGHIVNTASGMGLAGSALTVPYSTTKHAVVGLSTTLRPEAAAHGVRVSVLCPGAVETPILDKGPPADLPAGTATVTTARQYLKVLGLSPMPADRFARRALAQVAANKAIIIEPRSVKGLWYVHRLSPAITEHFNRMTARRVLKDIQHRTAARPR